MRLVQAILIVLAVSLVGACSNQGLRSLSNPGEGPDEFRITPGLPLEEPQDYNALPAPTPRGSNRTDQVPLQESGTWRTQAGRERGHSRR